MSVPVWLTSLDTGSLQISEALWGFRYPRSRVKFSRTTVVGTMRAQCEVNGVNKEAVRLRWLESSRDLHEQINSKPVSASRL